MKNKFVNSVSLVMIFGVTVPGLLSATECLTAAPNGYYAPFSMVTQRNEASGDAYASYTTGILWTSSTSTLFYHSETYSGTGLTQLFSDRTAQVDCPPPGVLGFCASQPFDIHQADKLGVSLTKSTSLLVGGGSASPYSGTLTLESWGNGKSTFPLTCDANTGILYGALGSDSHVAITIGTAISPPK